MPDRPLPGRAALAGLALLVLPGAALADSRCARVGTAAYSADRIMTSPGAPPTTVRFHFQGGLSRIEAPGPGGGRLVTLLGPELRAVFSPDAPGRPAMRLPAPSAPSIPREAIRTREERAGDRVTLITEVVDEGNVWREVERVVCRTDGVLLEARQTVPRDGRPVVQETRQTNIRVGPQDAALFRLPAGTPLTDPPPPPPGARR